MSLRAALLFAAVAAGAAELPAQAAEPEPRVVRTECAGEVDGVAVRLTSLMDVSRTRQSVFSSDSLYSVGDRIYLVRTDIDAREPRRRAALLTGRRAERFEVLADARDAGLTLAQIKDGFRLVRVGEGEVLVAMDDVGAPTVRRRLDGMLEAAFRPEALADLRLLRRILTRCSLLLGLGGDAFSVLFGDRHLEEAGCPGAFAPADPDPRRDERFLTLDPSLRERLSRPAAVRGTSAR